VLLLLAEVSPPPLTMPVLLLPPVLLDSSPESSEPLMLALMPPEISVVPLRLSLMLPASSPSVALTEPEPSVGAPLVPVGSLLPPLLLPLALSDADTLPLSSPQPAAITTQNPTTARVSHMRAA